MFAYCGNTPVNAVDSTGQSFLLVAGIIGATLGAIIGGCAAATQGGDVLSGICLGAAAGGVAGLGCGAVASTMLAGSALASTASVMTGANALSTTVVGSGVSAGAMMIADNISQAINKAPQVFWSGGEAAMNAAAQLARDTGGLTLEMTRLGQHLMQTDAGSSAWNAASQNFANVANNVASTIYSVQNAGGIRLQSVWATIEYPLIKLREIVYSVVG